MKKWCGQVTINSKLTFLRLISKTITVPWSKAENNRKSVRPIILSSGCIKKLGTTTVICKQNQTCTSKTSKSSWIQIDLDCSCNQYYKLYNFFLTNLFVSRSGIICSRSAHNQSPKWSTQYRRQHWTLGWVIMGCAKEKTLQRKEQDQKKGGGKASQGSALYDNLWCVWTPKKAELSLWVSLLESRLLHTLV